MALVDVYVLFWHPESLKAQVQHLSLNSYCQIFNPIKLGDIKTNNNLDVEPTPKTPMMTYKSSTVEDIE